MSDGYAAVLAAHAVLYIALGLWVVYLRITKRVGIGDGKDHQLKRAIRVHANFAEWVPITLLVLGVAELRGADPVWVAGLGAVLFAGRLAHLWGLGRSPGASIGRQGGTAVTLGVLLAGVGLMW